MLDECIFAFDAIFLSGNFKFDIQIIIPPQIEVIITVM